MQLGEWLEVTSAEQQQRLGRGLAQVLPRVVFLQGEMGAGKTTLVQGIARGMGFIGEVSSPTYALMHEYPTPAGLLLHVDAYRTQHPGELYEMGLEDYVDRCRLVLIEWGEKLYSDFPEAWILKLDYTAFGRSITRIR